jgi:hypothetical protein
MALIRARDSARAPRHWALIGPRLVGKSTFLTAMAKTILVVDTEGRGREIDGVNNCEVFLPDVLDRQDPLAISQALRRDARDIQEAGIQLIAIDSLTPIYKRMAAEALAKNERRLNKNKSSAFVDKANAIRLFQDAAVSLGTDVAMIWHYETGRDGNGKEIRNQTISEMERQKLARSLNGMIELKREKNRRVARIVWSRAGGRALQGVEIEDAQGFWKGVPEQIDALFAEAGKRRQERIPAEAQAS